VKVTTTEHLRQKAKNGKGGLGIYAKIEYTTMKCTGQFLDLCANANSL